MKFCFKHEVFGSAITHMTLRLRRMRRRAASQGCVATSWWEGRKHDNVPHGSESFMDWSWSGRCSVSRVRGMLRFIICPVQNLTPEITQGSKDWYVHTKKMLVNLFLCNLLSSPGLGFVNPGIGFSLPIDIKVPSLGKLFSQIYIILS